MKSAPACLTAHLWKTRVRNLRGLSYGNESLHHLEGFPLANEMMQVCLLQGWYISIIEGLDCCILLTQTGLLVDDAVSETRVESAIFTVSRRRPRPSIRRTRAAAARRVQETVVVMQGGEMALPKGGGKKYQNLDAPFINGEEGDTSKERWCGGLVLRSNLN